MDAKQAGVIYLNPLLTIPRSSNTTVVHLNFRSSDLREAVASSLPSKITRFSEGYLSQIKKYLYSGLALLYESTLIS